MTTVPSHHMEAMRAGEAQFLRAVASLDDADLSAPSALPGWDRAHVVGHMARNADALGNLLDWAATGVETPMYPSAAARDAGIERSAAQAPGELRADAQEASNRLLARIGQLEAPAWSAVVRTARGRPITASEVPWMRIRESFVHSVDLRCGVTFDSAPDAVVRQLLEEVASTLSAHADCPAVLVVDDMAGGDDSVLVRLGDPGAHPVRVHGSARAALAWLTGRSRGEGLAADTPGGSTPALPPWL